MWVGWRLGRYMLGGRACSILYIFSYNFVVNDIIGVARCSMVTPADAAFNAATRMLRRWAAFKVGWGNMP